MKRILILGCGYAGERLAARHIERGDRVAGTTRNAERAARLRETGVRVLAPHEELPQADRAYYTIPPQRDGVDDIRLTGLLKRLPAPREFIYFSSTGVYGDRDGAWVNEDTELAPNSERSMRRADAEWQCRGWCAMHGVALTVLRVAGIYGPGRLPVERLDAGTPVLDPQSSGYSNRIHVDDLVAAAMATADAHGGGMAEVFNVADGQPTTTAEFLDAFAAMTGKSAPSRIGWAEAETRFSEMALSFMRDSKRVSVDRLLAVNGFRLRYPDFRDGLRASLEETA